MPVDSSLHDQVQALYSDHQSHCRMGPGLRRDNEFVHLPLGQQRFRIGT